MNYTSTRDSALCTGASTAILTGIAPGGGLFVPQQFPQVDMREFYGLTYPQTAQKVLGMFLTDYDPDFLKTRHRADIQHRKLRRQGRLCGACGREYLCIGVVARPDLRV